MTTPVGPAVREWKDALCACLERLFEMNLMHLVSGFCPFHNGCEITVSEANGRPSGKAMWWLFVIDESQ